MSDVALVALFSGSATVLVALFGLLGNVFGPARAERVRADRQRQQEEVARKMQARELKIQRAEQLSEAIVHALGRGDWAHHAAEDQARIRFIATLEPGEGPVAEYVKNISEGLEDESGAFERKRIALDRLELVFDWLRGDAPIDAVIAANKAAKA
ncbi:hypothetical protein PQI23_13405 [Leucobacter sp. USCH14]|uniref:hypothetical protein n=1 Tax=Leucobacter sp. USCH14 TaxID=3024838 RepID=UPI0030ADEB58